MQNAERRLTMSVEEQIHRYIAGLPEPKRGDVRALHELALKLSPGCRTWFLDGKNEQGKVVSNPNIGYGSSTIKHADGSEKEFYRVGLSANTSGISVYVMGLKDKTYLAKTFGKSIGKAKVTGYCIKFRALKDLDVDVLKAAMKHGFDSRD
jgi:hypothetical protein